MKDKFSIDILITFALISCLLLLSVDVYTGFYNELNNLELTDRSINQGIKQVYLQLPFLSNSFFLRIIILGVFMLGTFGISLKKKPEEDSDLKKYVISVIISFSLFVLSGGFKVNLVANLIITFASWTGFIWSFLHIRKHFNFFSSKDEFNNKNLIFQQEKVYKENPYSVNLKTENGLINVVNPFRATMVLGTPGSGKSYSVIEEYIRQHIMKNFSMMVYDFKFPSLAKETYAFYEYYKNTYKVTPKFTVISLDDIPSSNFVNPISPNLIRKTADAIEASQTVLFNLNKEWITKKDFFAQSAISYFACCIYFLKLFENGKFCTLPHAIALASCPDEKVFKVFQRRPELRFFMTPFADALAKQAYEQLSGQTATARIPLSQLATRELFWVMGNNVYPELNASLDINNPEDPQIMILANSPTTQTTNSPALGLISTQLLKVVNVQNKLPSSIILDELPTMYFMGLDNLIATARSNKVSTTIGMQDLEQLKRDYGDKVAETIFNIVGNIFSGSVRSGTATKLQEIFGKKKQRLKNMTVDTSTTSYSINESMDFAIPVSTISQLSQGEFVGIVADNFGEEIKQKVFRGHIKVDKRTDQIKKDIPFVINEDNLEELLDGNFKRIVDEIDIIIANELAEISETEEKEKGEEEKKEKGDDGKEGEGKEEESKEGQG
ncbi:type IV secretory system conjugative DNA transfer family protein [Zobellia galactanivorans]|uniref:Putative mobilization protein MobC n=1 Tax=Zobellia galactanivorans (strain DSM 12802 / CCUG 47099 / CIP 106680 / NCIMB 13871 / Dsij) TaxID=63186 RepID=G0L794_ZOBGA|nr:type IV secretory system conjugative DNA transfer family protein [Zobellia galactanivorans]MBU3027542.1 TraM recognition domain-containing protein [Zobellia galactanivorans]CAZ97237.1 Putative mobilization protein MobC [Zobellia galactanivorans]